MKRLRWTPLAFDDLRDISIYVERQRSLAAANRVCRIIYGAIQILSRFPESGKIGVELGTREWVVPSLPSYTVVYRIPQTNVVQILRIWHGAQQR